MKKTNKVNAFLVSTLLLSLTACGSKAYMPAESAEMAAQEQTSTAKQSEKETDSASASGNQSENAAQAPAKETPDATSAITPIHLSVTEEYLSEWEEFSPVLLSSTSQVSVLSDGYSQLKETLSAQNREWYDEMQKVYDDNLEIAREFAGNGTEINFEYSLTATPVRSDEKIVSLSVDEYSYLGGAHPNSYIVGYNLNPLTGKEYALKDVVTDYDRLYQMTGEQLKENYPADSFFEGYEEMMKSMFYDEKGQYGRVQWTMDMEGITLHFNNYDLGPYAAGRFEVRFDFSQVPELFQPAFRYDGKAMAKRVEPGTGCMADVDGDGQKELVTYHWIDNEEDFTTQVTLECGDSRYETELYGNLSEVYLVRNEEGDSYLYVERIVENDYQYLEVFSLKNQEITPVGTSTDATYGTPIMYPEEFLLYDRLDMLGTYMAYRRFSVGADGMPETEDTVYKRESSDMDYVITSLVEIPVQMHDNAAAEPHEEILPAGTRFHLRATDNATYAEMELDDGRRCDISVDTSDYPKKINGVSEYDCFDGLHYAG